MLPQKFKIIFPRYWEKMPDTVFVKNYEGFSYNKKEILRYCGVKEENEEIAGLLKNCLNECENIFSYKVCYIEVPVKTENNTVDFGFAKTESAALYKNLAGCGRAVLFAATAGLGIDRLILKYSRVSAAKAVMFQAIGAERIEALCNGFCDDLQKRLEMQSLFLRPRFSPGYGDFSIEFQRNMFSVLDCNRKIGLSLNESMLMMPSKSVTAVIGISNSLCRRHDENCLYCEIKNCNFRRSK